MRPFQPK
jgi:hypothetical protein